jgi:alcohol dehydrogenase class IV
MFTQLKKIALLIPLLGTIHASSQLEDQVKVLAASVCQLSTSVDQIKTIVKRTAEANVAEQMGNIADAMKQGVTARVEPSKDLLDAMKNLKVDHGLPTMTSVIGVSGALLSGYYFYQWCQKKDTDPNTGNNAGWAAGLGLAASLLTLCFGK